MDFFEQQDQARSNTRKLVVLFILAVISLLVMTNLLIMLVFGYLNTETLATGTLLSQFDWHVFLVVSVIVAAVILIGSLYKIASLSSGGTTVADMLGGELLVHNGSDLNRQKVLNVVEEMAIASGTPVPPVYLLDEAGINAFAAGFTPGDAVIGITRGAIETLDREQLQGVIAHEFSHILNGDMRLNIRLIGILHGILVIGMIGYHLMRSGRHSRKNAGGVVLLGLGLMIIGYAGTFFGNLIKAAVSRQREFLADASAVQFTRNPDGISGALINIGASQYGSLIDNPDVPEISHCLFGAGMSNLYSGLFATHPPLEERIRRVKPSWNGIFTANRPRQKDDTPQQAEDSEATKKRAFSMATAAILANAVNIQHSGEPGQQHLDAAVSIIEQLPFMYVDAVHEPHGARAVIYTLLLDDDAGIRQRQLSHLEFNADSGVYEVVKALYDERNKLDEQAWLPLIEMALPTLRQLSKPQYELFRSMIDRLIEIDGRIRLTEWIIKKLVQHHLDGVFSGKAASRAKYRSVKQVSQEIGQLLSLLINSSRQGSLSRTENFMQACQTLGLVNLELLPASALSISKLDQALSKLNQLLPMEKHLLLKACAACIMSDNIIQPKEAELYRMVSEVIDCPVSPLLETGNDQ